MLDKSVCVCVFFPFRFVFPLANVCVNGLNVVVELSRLTQTLSHERKLALKTALVAAAVAEPTTITTST